MPLFSHEKVALVSNSALSGKGHYIKLQQSMQKDYYTLNSLTLFWLAESVQWIFKISARYVMTADYTIITSRTLKVTGNHFKFAHFVLQKHDFHFFVQCIIKQLLDWVFVISRIIKVSVRVIRLRLRLWLITPTETLIFRDITKTSSNNCLLKHIFGQGVFLVFNVIPKFSWSL